MSTQSPYKLVFYEKDEEFNEISKDDRLFEQCNEFELGDSIDENNNCNKLNKLDSKQRFNRRRKLPKIPDNKKPLQSLIGRFKETDSNGNKIVRQISNTLSLEIKLSEQTRKPISLKLINIDEELNLKQSNESLNKLNGEIDYRPLSCQLNEQLDETRSNQIVNNSMNAFNSKIEGNYRGLHKFIARHSDEICIEIGDSIFVIKQEDDLWFKGINLATNTTGYFPSLYVIDCNYKELFQTVNYFQHSDDDSGLNELSSNDSNDLIDTGKQAFQKRKERFHLEFLGSLEVAKSKGNQVLEQCIKKVVQTYIEQATKQAKEQHLNPFLCILEISDLGLRFYNHHQLIGQVESNLIDLNEINESKVSGVNRDKIDNRIEWQNCQIKNDQSKQENDYFFHLKNITFCGFTNSIIGLDDCFAFNCFAFITQHPTIKNKYACHVFNTDQNQVSKDICESIGNTYYRYYLNYIELSQNFKD